MLYNPMQSIESNHSPKISVSSSGLITATCDDASTTKQLTKQAAATITPGTSAKTAVAAGRYTTGAVEVAGDANLVAGNIKSGVSIFGVTGSLDLSSALNFQQNIAYWKWWAQDTQISNGYLTFNIPYPVWRVNLNWYGTASDGASVTVSGALNLGSPYTDIANSWITIYSTSKVYTAARVTVTGAPTDRGLPCSAYVGNTVTSVSGDNMMALCAST